MKELRYAGMILLALLAIVIWACAPAQPQEPITVQVATGGVTYEAYSFTMTGTGEPPVSANTQALRGELLGVYIDYTASITATTDLTLTYASPLGGQILTVVNNVTDGIYFPRAALVTNANAAITDGNDRHALNGAVTVQVGQSTPGVSAVLYFIMER